MAGPTAWSTSCHWSVPCSNCNEGSPGGGRGDQARGPTPTAPQQQLVREGLAMASYALASGRLLAPQVAEVLQDHLLGCRASSVASNVPFTQTVSDLTWAHGQLTRLVAPAAPRAVLLLAPEPAGQG